MVNWKVIISIARTHLFSRVKQTSIAALGVTFGISTYIIMMSFMTGMNGMLDSLILNRTPHIHIYNDIKPSDEQPVDLVDELKNSMNVVHSIKPKFTQARLHNAIGLMQSLEHNKKVRGVTPQVAAQSFYLAGAIQLNGMVTGINVLDEVELFNFGDYIVKGNAEDLARSNEGILLGAGVAKKLSLDVGDRIQISTMQGGIHNLKIVGIFQSGLADFDNIQSYANIKTVQKLLGEGPNYITDVNVKLHDMTEAKLMSQDISDEFGVTAVDIETANAQFEAGTQIRNMISYAVSFALLLVAGFGIYNILNMLIYEKMNDIAILKATGFSGRDVQLIFISQAVLIGLMGGVLGLLIGLGGSAVINGLPFETEALPTMKTFPVNFDPTFYSSGIIFALASTFLAGYLPSKKAKKIDPVEIIRGQ